MTKLLTVAATAGAALGLVACGSTSSPGSTSGKAAAKTTFVSCLTTKGLAIGWYDPSNTDASGNAAPTTLPASFDFAKGGIQNYSVVKGQLPVEGPKGPLPNAPILNVSYQPDAAVNVREGAGHHPGLVAIGNFTVAWQHETQSEVNMVIACVHRYTRPVNDAAAQRAQEAAINRALAGFKPPTNASTWTASTRAVFLNGCENAGGDTPSTCQCALTALVTNVNYLDFLSIEQSYKGSGIPQKLLQYMGKCVLSAAQTVTTPTTTTQTCNGKYYTPSMAAAGCPTEGRGPKPTAANQWPCPAGDREITNSAGPGCTGPVAACANGCNYVPSNVPATPTTSTSSTASSTASTTTSTESSTASTTSSDTTTATGGTGQTCTPTPGSGGGTPACDGATSTAGGIGGPGN